MWVAGVLIERQPGRVLSCHLFFQAVGRDHHRTVGHGIDIATEARIALYLGLVADEQPTVGAELHVVDSEPLSGPELAVDRVQRPAVAPDLAAAVAVQPARPRQRWGDDDGLAGLHGDRCDVFGHRRGKKWRLRLRQRNPDRVRQCLRHGGVLVELDVEPDHRCRRRADFRCGRGCSEETGPLADLVTREGEQRDIAVENGHRSQRHLLGEGVGQK